NKVKDIEKKCEDNLGKFAVAIDNRFEKRKESKKVYDERDKWIKNLNPVFQIIQEEDWPKLVVKGIRTGTPENVVKEDLEESLCMKFRANPIWIGTDHSTLEDIYVLAFRSEEDRYDALTRDSIVRYNRLRIFDYKPQKGKRGEPGPTERACKG
ncbi:hypothetical protein D0Z03_003058, partial [Geotrichum reessii]